MLGLYNILSRRRRQKRDGLVGLDVGTGSVNVRVDENGSSVLNN